MIFRGGGLTLNDTGEGYLSPAGIEKYMMIFRRFQMIINIWCVSTMEIWLGDKIWCCATLP